MNRSSRIFIAGGKTLHGQAIREQLLEKGYTNLVGSGEFEPDLKNHEELNRFYLEMKPEYVFLVAGESGGIALNQEKPVNLMLDNLICGINVLQLSHQWNVRKLLYLGSSCSYPRMAPQPMGVESLFTGPLEPTSAPYAMAKLTLGQLCQAYHSQHKSRFIYAIPANCFGPHDDFNPSSGHVIPSLIRRAHEAKMSGSPSLEIWGSGNATREFLFSRDMADAAIFLMKNYNDREVINLGGGTETSIRETAEVIAATAEFKGKLVWNTARPDGMPRKGLDCKPLSNLGWKPQVEFPVAIRTTYEWYLGQLDKQETEDKDNLDEPAKIDRKYDTSNR